VILNDAIETVYDRPTVSLHSVSSVRGLLLGPLQCILHPCLLTPDLSPKFFIGPESMSASESLTTEYL